jgi:hypothetical protein
VLKAERVAAISTDPGPDPNSNPAPSRPRALIKLATHFQGPSSEPNMMLPAPIMTTLKSDPGSGGG